MLPAPAMPVRPGNFGREHVGGRDWRRLRHLTESRPAQGLHRIPISFPILRRRVKIFRLFSCAQRLRRSIARTEPEYLEERLRTFPSEFHSLGRRLHL